MDKMTPEDIVTALSLEYEAADQCRSTYMADEQETALKFYDAQPFGDEQDGRSQVVLPDVKETVDYMCISVLGAFISGDRVVEFEADEEEYEQGAEDATEAVQYSFMRDQDGYKVLHDWLKAGLIEKYCATKTTCVTEEKVSRETLQINEEQVLAFESGEMELPEGVTIEDIEETEGGLIATLKTEKLVKRYVDMPLPSEEYRFSQNAQHEDTVDYQCHACPKTRSELVEMGFDKEQVYNLPLYDRDDFDSRSYERDDQDGWHEEESTVALQKVLLLEEYARMDVDGDGIAERVKVFRVGDEILLEGGKPSIETIEEQPIVVFTPFPSPHRMVGDGLAERVFDLQRIRSLFARQMIEGQLNSNNPRPLVDMNNAHPNTIEDLLNVIPGAPIRFTGNAPMPYQSSFDMGSSLSAMEFFAGERESRTGITRMNQGLDRDALNKTAAGTAMMQAQGQQYEEYIARNFASCLGRLFVKKYKLMKREGDKMRLKVDGKYKTVDPSQWPDEVKVNVRVGLGTGNKDKRVQARMMLLELQREGMDIGLTDKMGLYKNGSALVRDLDLGAPDDYFVNPEEAQQEQGEEQPSAEEQAMQAEQQREDAKMQADQQKTQAQLQLDQMKAQSTVELTREKHSMDMEVAREKAALDNQLARDKASAELQLAQQKSQAEMGLAMQNAAHERKIKQDLPDNRPGGDLDK